MHPTEANTPNDDEEKTTLSVQPRAKHRLRWLVGIVLALVLALWIWLGQTVSGRVTAEAIGLAWHLARGGAISLSASEVPIDGKPSDIELATQADGSVWLQIRHPKAAAALALGANANSGRLLLAQSKLALVMDPTLPDFAFGDPAIDELPLPPFEVPRLGPVQALALPLLLRHVALQPGADDTLVWEASGKSATAFFIKGQLARVIVRGILPGKQVLEVRVDRLAPGALANKIKSVEDLPEGTRTEAVSRGIFLRSIDGLFASIAP